jgi:hypothetical protein
MDLGEIGWGCVDWIGTTQDRDKWRALVYVVMNLLENSSMATQLVESWIVLSSIVLISQLHLGLPSDLFPSSFPTNNLHAFLFSPVSATSPAHLWLDTSNYS